MRHLVSLIAVLFLTATVYSQTPQSFAFQSMITDTLGNPYGNNFVSVKFDIHAGSGSGTVVYSEQHSSVATSATGYFSANVGEGSVLTGAFNTIDWGSSTYWLEVSVDTLGGSNYVSLGSSQLLSVPYALYSGNGSGFTPAVFQGGLYGYVTTGPETCTLIPDVDVDANSASMYSGSALIVPATGLYRIECFGSSYVNGTYITLKLNAVAFDDNGSPVSSNFLQLDKIVSLTAGDVLTIDFEGADTYGITLRLTQIR